MERRKGRREKGRGDFRLSAARRVLIRSVGNPWGQSHLQDGFALSPPLSVIGWEQPEGCAAYWGAGRGEWWWILRWLVQFWVSAAPKQEKGVVGSWRPGARITVTSDRRGPVADSPQQGACLPALTRPPLQPRRVPRRLLNAFSSFLSHVASPFATLRWFSPLIC